MTAKIFRGFWCVTVTVHFAMTWGMLFPRTPFAFFFGGLLGVLLLDLDRVFWTRNR